MSAFLSMAHRHGKSIIMAAAALVAQGLMPFATAFNALAPAPEPRRKAPPSKGGKRNPMGTRCRIKRAAANRYVYAIKGARP